MSAPRPLRSLVVLSWLVWGVGCASAPGPVEPGGSLEVAAWPVEAPPAEASQPPAAPKTVQTLTRHEGVEPGRGSEQRERVALAVELALNDRLEEAHAVLDGVLHAFHDQMGDRAAIYVSVANAEELALFRQLVPEERAVIWLDWSFREALHAKAFLAVGERDFDQAMEFLDVEATFAPFAASAHCERGYILNHLKRPGDGLEAYKTALDLSLRFASSSPDTPVALRGIGFSLVELGDLDGAEEAYRQALQLQPESAVAKEELEYIQRLRRGGK